MLMMMMTMLRHFGNCCLNWYTQPQVKKIVGPVDEAAEDLARRRTGLGLHTHWLYIGQSGSGKTQMVLSHLALTSGGPKCAYARVVICTTMTEEPLYVYLKETLKDKCKLYSPSELPDVDQLVPNTPKKGDNVFLICDDLIADLERNQELLRRVTRYAIFGRKEHVTMVFLSQNFYASTRDTKSILKAIGGIVEADTMLRMLHHCKARVKGAPSDLAITLDECPLSRKFAYNFTGWLNPADFEQAKRGGGLTSDAPTDDRKSPAAAPPDAPDDDRDLNPAVRPAALTAQTRLYSVSMHVTPPSSGCHFTRCPG
eukprot:gene17540-12548_t